MLNHIVIMGRLVRDPELRNTTSGTAVASFTLAVNRDYKNQNGEKEADFIPCVAWKGTAELVSKYLSKGRMVSVDGRLQSRKYEDKDGNNRTAYELVASSVYFCDSRSEEMTEREQDIAYKNQQTEFQRADISYEDEYLPF